MLNFFCPASLLHGATFARRVFLLDIDHLNQSAWRSGATQPSDERPENLQANCSFIGAVALPADGRTEGRTRGLGWVGHPCGSNDGSKRLRQNVRSGGRSTGPTRTRPRPRPTDGRTGGFGWVGHPLTPLAVQSDVDCTYGWTDDLPAERTAASIPLS